MIRLLQRASRPLKGVRSRGECIVPVTREPIIYARDPCRQTPLMLRTRFPDAYVEDDALSDASSGHGASEMDPLTTPTHQLEHDDGDDELESSTPPTSHRRKMFLLANRFPTTHAFLRKAFVYIQGPSPPLSLQHTPLLDRTYSFRNFNLSINLESRWLRLTRRFNSLPLLIALGVLYIISLAFLVRANWYLVPADAFTGCTAAFWAAKDGCGLNGEDCTPFNSTQPIDFRCPASCTSTMLLNIRTVGDQQVRPCLLSCFNIDVNETFVR